MKKGARRRYREVLKLGCKLEWSHTMDGSECECGHYYKWDCDHCPVVIEQFKRPIETVEDLVDLIVDFNSTGRTNEGDRRIDTLG